jgi:hypothetical protein
MSEQHEVFDFSKKFTKTVLKRFADILIEMQGTINFKVSSRGWCYLMEQAGYINKAQFDKVDSAINRLRKEGMLPVNFVAEETARGFANVEKPNELTPGANDMEGVLKWMLGDVLKGSKYYTPNWWDGEVYYIQMVVEKIDLKTLFTPIAHEYHIPIANAKGWSSILQRAEYARRFKEAEDRGLKCVLLYCGDHDADGLRISDTIRKNLYDLKDVVWGDGKDGYDPSDLIIQRFGLNYDFIIENGYTWIDNLITGSGMNLADPSHKNFKLPYVQDYLSTVGERKCEANAIVTTPHKAEMMVRTEIEKWLGPGSAARFEARREEVEKRYAALLRETGLIIPIKTALGEDLDPQDDPDWEGEAD